MLSTIHWAKEMKFRRSAWICIYNLSVAAKNRLKLSDNNQTFLKDRRNYTCEREYHNLDLMQPPRKSCKRQGYSSRSISLCEDVFAQHEYLSVNFALPRYCNVSAVYSYTVVTPRLIVNSLSLYFSSFSIRFGTTLA